MNVDTDSLPVQGIPQFLDDAKVLCDVIRNMNYTQVKALWGCNDKLAELNYQRFAGMNLEQNLTPAVLSYEGLQYKHMSAMVFSEKAIGYVNQHLRILSGLYGVLAPFDGIVPYRLEMQAKITISRKKDLYDFWGDRLYRALLDDDRTIINLASKEYSMAVEKYLMPQDRFITITFGELQGGKVRQKGTFAKMARGEMVRFMADNHIKELDGLKGFQCLGYHYSDEYSSDNELVFLMQK